MTTDQPRLFSGATHVERKTIRKKDIASTLGVTERTVDNWRKNPAFPVPMIIGRSVFFMTDDVEAWVATRRGAAGSLAEGM